MPFCIWYKTLNFKKKKDSSFLYIQFFQHYLVKSLSLLNGNGLVSNYWIIYMRVDIYNLKSPFYFTGVDICFYAINMLF